MPSDLKTDVASRRPVILPEDDELTRAVKGRAMELGADLVGVAPVERWAKAPIEHSPQGILPEARSVVVSGIHFLDAPTELGAEEDPRWPGPALTEMNASACLQHLVFRLAKWLQDRGYQAITTRQSGAWSYRPQPGAPRGWIADMCNYYAAVCAGLGEVGWNNLCLTPEFGPRQRFVSVITDAPLSPTPMYTGPALCDRCKLCAKNCPTQSFEKDISGEMLSIEVDGRRFEFPDRNLWRCAIGENFMLDVFLDEWKDRRVTEDLVLEMEERAVTEHPEWVRGWKMGMCLKHCMPPERRYFDRSYCKAPRRRRDVAPDPSPEACERTMDALLKRAGELGVDIVAAAPAEAFREGGIDLTEYLPDARSAIVLGIGYPENSYLATDFVSVRAELMLGKLLQEEFGFSAVTRSELDAERAALVCGAAREDDTPVEEGSRKGYWLRAEPTSRVATDAFGKRQIWRTIVTSAPLPRSVTRTTALPPAGDARPESLTQTVREVAREAGMDLVGVAPASRLADAAGSLDEVFGRIDDYFVVEDAGWDLRGVNVWGGQGHPFNPKAREVRLKAGRPADYLEGAKSVIVVGLGLPGASIDRVGRPPASKAGHFQSAVHEESQRQMALALLQIARFLDAAGYRTSSAPDLTGLASQISDDNLDLTASRFAALAAGLGDLGWNGLVLTPKFGARQRFACLVTDADLVPDNVYDGPPLCSRCGDCAAACPVAAISQDETYAVEIGGRTFEWGRPDRLRCDFAQRYALTAEEGGKYIGCENDFPLPDQMTPEGLCEAVRNRDRIQRPSYTPTVQRCFTVCRSHERHGG